MIEINKIYNENCLDTLNKMPDNFIDCVITSPPYFNLKDYDHKDQWGLENSFEEYLNKLYQMMDLIYKKLKNNGTVWINLGDTYDKNKCLLLIPHRFAIGCIDRGWIIRNDIIWSKRNALPESVTDRFSKKHEYFFFMVKQNDYYFNLDAIRDKYKYEIKYNNKNSNLKSKYDNLNIETLNRQGMNKNRGNNLIIKRNKLPDQKIFVDFLRSRTSINMIVNSTNLIKSKVEHWFRYDINGFSFPSIEDWNKFKFLCDNFDEDFFNMDLMITDFEIETDDILKNKEKGKNPGDVCDFWDIPNKPTKNKHYAAYNIDLLIKPILSGCKEKGIIYDPFMGSGSTAEACLRSNRKFIGSELNKDYIEISNKRLNPYLTQTKLF